MNEKQVVSASKFLSLILRHKPETVGIELDENGWANVDTLLSKMAEHGKPITMDELGFVVETNDKQRFAFSADRTSIRANQGHSIDVNLELQELTPPEFLYHGTATRNLDSIKEFGLTKQQRHHVHLSEDQAVAHSVGQRYGKPIVLVIQALEMQQQGHTFYRSNNGVWLTDQVPVQHITNL
ncbi:MAG: RNA 2'-phosphotransferase [Flavobacteriales bacterium]|nr:RNA 2'-phosphotransferase [Flavobacteriales bacterium]